MSPEHLLVFYDGHCGLCHRAVKFALHHDPEGSRFRFAPLQGSTLREQLTPTAIGALSDSIVVLSKDGDLLQQSDAVLRMLEEIGGGWASLARIGSLIPGSLRDFAYQGIAKVRHRVFRRPDEVCPLVPDELRARFLP